MVLIYTRPNCVYCPMVKKYLEHKGIEYKEMPTSGEAYEKLSQEFGFSVPLITNGEKGMVGYSIPKLNQLLGV